MTNTTDRIEKTIVLQAPVERVWRAISEAGQFGRRFGFQFSGEFAAGERMTGTLVPTKVDPEVGKRMEQYAGWAVEIVVERIEPMQLFSYRWHPFAIDASVDYSNEPMTLVEFALEETPGGTKLTITESGFDAIPLGRRVDAFEANEEGWSTQAGLIEKYLEQTSS